MVILLHPFRYVISAHAPTNTISPGPGEARSLSSISLELGFTGGRRSYSLVPYPSWRDPMILGSSFR